MILAIFAFIVTYAWLSSTAWYQSHSITGEFRRSIHIAANLRSFVSAVGLLGVLLESLGYSKDIATILYLPDFMAGLIAVGLSSSLFSSLGMSWSYAEPPTSANFFIGRPDAFIPTFATTATEGFIISASLLLLVLLVALGRSFLATLSPRFLSK